MNLIEVWKNKGKILEGVKNNIFKKEHIEEIFEERKKICEQCSSHDITGTKCMVPGTQPCCGECGCSDALKLRSLSSECPRGFWKAITSEEEEDLINEKLNNESNI